MSISEYFEQFHEEDYRYDALVKEALRLEQKERAREIRDEQYEFIFNHYQRRCEARDLVRKKIEQEQNSNTRRLFVDIEQDLVSICDDLAKKLDNFIALDSFMLS